MFKDLRLEYNKEEMTVSTWGPVIKIRREDQFLSSLSSGGREVLASPVRLVPRINGREIGWHERTGFFVEESGDRVVYHEQARADCDEDSIRLNTRITLEKDGLIWYDVMLLAESVEGLRWDKFTLLDAKDTWPKLDGLTLEIPVDPTLAELFHFWPFASFGDLANSGAVPEDGMKLPFKPMIWLGKEEAGIAFYTETDENWQPADKNETLTVEVKENETVLKVHLLDSAPALWEKQKAEKRYPFMPLRFSFGLQATPVKPYKKAQKFERSVAQAYELVPQNQEELDAQLDTYASKGAKWYTVHETWSAIQNYGMPKNKEAEDAVRNFNRSAHKHGLKTIPYFGYEYSTPAPGFYEKADSYLNKDKDGYYGGLWHQFPHQMAYLGCLGGEFAQASTERFLNALDNYGFDGLYLDSTFRPVGCANPAHGCGYTDLEGKRHPTYPMRKIREFAKNLYEEVHKRGGIVEVHSSSYCGPMHLAYCDSYFDGEQIRLKQGQNLMDSLSTAAMRAEFLGRNWGVPSQICLTDGPWHIACPTQSLYGLFLLYDADIKVYGKVDTKIDLMSRYWKIMDDFGTDTSEFHPFWKKECPVTAKGEAVYCSVWKQEDKWLALLVNLGTDAVETGINVGREYKEISFCEGSGDPTAFTAQPRESYFIQIKL